MRKITFSFLALLLTAVGAWAQTVKLQPSTDKDSPEFVYYLANGNERLMDTDLAFTGSTGKVPGRFAFFPVAGKADTYKIMDIDGTGDNKWLGYTDATAGMNKVSLVAEADAKMWQITSSEIYNKSFKGYQMRAYNSDGSLSGVYMCWNEPNTSITVGFNALGASDRTASGWVLALAPISGREYFIFDKTHNVYLSLTKLHSEGNVTTTATPEKCKITRTDDGKWIISTTGDNPQYLYPNSSKPQVGSDVSNSAWIVERVFDATKGEFDFMLKNTHPSWINNGYGKYYLGSADHKDNYWLWANAPIAEALRFHLQDGNTEYVDATILAESTTAGEPTYTTMVQLPAVKNLDLRTFLSPNGLLEYDAASAVHDVKNEANQTYTIKYTKVGVPFATSYAELTTDDKWVSFFTLPGRMYVYDKDCTYGGVKKYPAIDKTTFTNLSDNHMWGFVCENPLTDYIKIVNKGAGEAEGTLCMNLYKNTVDSPLLLSTSESSVVNEWLVERAEHTAIPVSERKDYYVLTLKGTDKYIDNYMGKGFMTTNTQGTENPGSNLKFVPEKETYEILQDRAVKAPAGAVNSLNAAARSFIKSNNDYTVDGYKKVIEDINNPDNHTGFIQFQPGGYYYLRNYTPAGENMKTYVLDSKDGATATTSEVLQTLAGTADEAMTYTNVNALWQITTTSSGDDSYTGGSNNIGVSKTIGRLVTHVNSGKQLTKVAGTGCRQLADKGATYYFVNLGAGQHFLKNEQFNGSGQQARAEALTCDDNGTLGNTVPAGTNTALDINVVHKKNTRGAWYGIPATDLYIKLNDGGDDKYYATAHFPFAVSIDAEETVKAYTVEDIDKDNGVLNLAEATGVIPAGTAMILIDENETAKLNILPEVTETAQADAILKGVNMARAFDADITADNVLVLGTGATGSKVGFYLPATGSTGLRSNSAYIPVSALDGVSAANGLKFNFGGVANGIDGVKADSNKGTVVYDLQGRRVNKLSKGLYIVNGKKVIL